MSDNNRTVLVKFQNSSALEFRVFKSMISNGFWPTKGSKKQPPEKDNKSNPRTTLEWAMEIPDPRRICCGKSELLSDEGYISIVWRLTPSGKFEHDVRSSGKLGAATQIQKRNNDGPVLHVTVKS